MGTSLFFLFSLLLVGGVCSGPAYRNTHKTFVFCFSEPTLKRAARHLKPSHPMAYFPSLPRCTCTTLAANFSFLAKRTDDEWIFIYALLHTERAHKLTPPTDTQNKCTDDPPLSLLIQWYLPLVFLPMQFRCLLWGMLTVLSLPFLDHSILFPGALPSFLNIVDRIPLASPVFRRIIVVFLYPTLLHLRVGEVSLQEHLQV